MAIELQRIEVAIQAQWSVCDAANHATLATRRAELTRRLEGMKQREVEPLVIQRPHNSGE